MMNELPLNASAPLPLGLLETNGSVLLLIVGIIALLFVGYLIFDWIRGLRASRRLEELRQRRRPEPKPADVR
jgi:uncharacterized protein (DUF58 family)